MMRTDFLCAAAFASCWASISVANTTSEDFWELSLQQLSQVEVNVASRSNERAREASSSITVFTRRDIEATGASTVEELMAFVPGFAVQNSVDLSGPRPTFAVRGRRRGSFNSDVLVLRDGLSLNSERLGGAAQSYYNLSLHNVRQIEVIRGPGSALYGSGAFVGVINIVTDDTLNDSSIGIGNHDLYQGHVNISQVAGDGHLIAQVYISDERGEMYRNIDDGMHRYSQDTRAGSNSHDALLKWKNDIFHVSAQQERRNLTGFVMNRFVDDNDNAEPSEINTARAGAQFGDSRMRHTFDVAYTEQNADLYLGFISREYLATLNANPMLPAGYALPERDLVTGTQRRTHQWNLDWKTSFDLGELQQLTAGASFRQMHEVNSNILGNYDVVAQVLNQLPMATYDEIDARANLYVDDHIEREIAGLYLQDRIHLRDDLRWDICLRYDHYTQIGEALSPRSSLVWAALPTTDFKLLYSRAFRAPTLSELYNSIYNQDVGNPQLDPETIDTAEAVWMQRFADAESTITLYNSNVDKGIDPEQRRRSTGSNYEYPINRDELSYTGIEWELLWQLSSSVSVRSALHHSFHADANVDSAPKNSAGIIASMKRDHWMASVNAVYYDEIETPAFRKLDAYTLVGMAMHYDIDGQWRVGLSASNVFDKSYRVFSRRYNTRSGQFSDGLPGAGPSQLLTLSYNY